MAIVFDTYAWIEYFKGTRKGKVVEKYLNEQEIITPVIVLLELSYKADKEKWDFKKHFDFIKHNSVIVGINEKFIFTFGALYNRIKNKIRKIGITDIIVINTARINNAKILTGDKHFENLDEVIIL